MSSVVCKHVFIPNPPPQPPFYSRDVDEMYDGILHKPLPLPPGKSAAVCSLLVGLLQKDQHRRLGAIADFVSPSFNRDTTQMSLLHYQNFFIGPFLRTAMHPVSPFKTTWQ